MSLAPLALFGFNRAFHLEQTVAHLKLNRLADQTDLYLFLDGPKNPISSADIEAVRKFCHTITGFRSITVVQREENLGLRQSMIAGVSQVAESHGRVIVVEDDVLTSPGFLEYMNSALDFYESYMSVGMISGYMPTQVSRQANLMADETVFHYRTNCWGWATWWSRWRLSDWEPSDWETYADSRSLLALLERGGSDMVPMLRLSMAGINQSWMARWYYNCFLHGMLTLWPGTSLTTNIGFDGSGVHANPAASAARYDKFRCDLSKAGVAGHRFGLPVAVNPKVHQAMKRFWDIPWRRRTPLFNPLKPAYRRLRTALGR